MGAGPPCCCLASLPTAVLDTQARSGPQGALSLPQLPLWVQIWGGVDATPLLHRGGLE